MSDLTDVEKEKREIEAKVQAELTEIRACLDDIRRRTGWGSVTIIFKGGEITDIEILISRKIKAERKSV